MKKLLLFLASLYGLLFQTFCQSASNVVISQVYGGGGNAGAQFRNDFVELFNPTSNPVSLQGWSLQYAAASGIFEAATKIDLAGVIGPGKYFLVQLGSGGNNGIALPVADQSGNINLASGSGKIALVNRTNLLPANLNCPPNGHGIVDYVGYGSITTANCAEGGRSAPALSATTAALRLNNGCMDTDDNRADFIEVAPSPRNSAAAAHNCQVRITLSNITPLPFCVDGVNGASGSVQYTISGPLPTALLVYLSDGTGSFGAPLLVGSTSNVQSAGTINLNLPANLPASPLYRLRADAATAYGEVSTAFEIINGAKNASQLRAFPDQNDIAVQWVNPSGCFDELMLVCKAGSGISGFPAGDGSNYVADPSFAGNGSPFDGGKVVYKGSGNSHLVLGLTLGTNYFFKLFTRKGNNWSTGIEVSATTRIIPQPGEVLINSFSPRYNNAAGEYFELVNVTGKTFNLVDLNFVYQDNRGSQRLPAGLSGTLEPYSFWLLAPSDSATVSVGKTIVLARDGTSGAGIADNGHIALVRRKDNLIVDAVGYGNVSGGTFIEGDPAPTVPASGGGGLRRKTDGLDNNNNSTDFEVVTLADIDLRNSTSRLANRGATIAAGSYRRLYVTGNSSIGGPVNLTEKLVLGSGRLALGNHNLTVRAAENGNANSFVQTNGAGTYTQQNINANPVLLPIGNSTYNPVTIAHGSGLDWSAAVSEGNLSQYSGGAIRRTWEIAHTGQLTNGTSVSFHYNDGDPAQTGPLFDPVDQVQVWHRPSGQWQKAGGPQNAGGTAGSMRTATLANWSQFSAFVVTNASAEIPLPVRFGHMQVVQEGRGAQLSFTVHNEEQVAVYEVEASANGSVFERLGVVRPRYNNGATAQYQFHDQQVPGGGRFYRVRAIEQDGAMYFSPVVRFRLREQLDNLVILPNPVQGNQVNYQTAQMPAGRYQLRITNGLGQVVLEQSLNHAGGVVSGTLVLPQVRKGWYVLEILGAEYQRKAFVIQ